MISNALEDKPLPIYGDGMQIRDWLIGAMRFAAEKVMRETGQARRWILKQD